jgi:predicted TIM-barrel fold metal-dependent hydrolase
MLTAHPGGPEYLGFVEPAERYERVGLDTTMAFTAVTGQYMPFPRDPLPRLRELGLAGKVLPGSDFPNIPYPYGDQLEAPARLELGDDWLRAVRWRNARGLFGLD